MKDNSTFETNPFHVLKKTFHLTRKSQKRDYYFTKKKIFFKKNLIYEKNQPLFSKKPSFQEKTSVFLKKHTYKKTTLAKKTFLGKKNFLYLGLWLKNLPLKKKSPQTKKIS